MTEGADRSMVVVGVLREAARPIDPDAVVVPQCTAVAKNLTEESKSLALDYTKQLGRGVEGRPHGRDRPDPLQSADRFSQYLPDARYTAGVIIKRLRNKLLHFFFDVEGRLQLLGKGS